MTLVRRLLGAAAFLATVGGRAIAESPAAAPDAQNACGADVVRFCKDVPRGEGRLRTCLLAHAKDLAPACRTRVESAAAGDGTTAAPPIGPASLRDCQQDLRTHCGSVKAGDGRLRACLDSYAAKLTPRCKASLARPRDTRPPK